MSTIKNIELIDDVRNDALILMKNNPSLSYDQAYSQAKEKLIGDGSIGEFEFKPFEVEVDPNLINEEAATQNEPITNSQETQQEVVQETKEENETIEQPALEKNEMSEEMKDDLEALKLLEGIDTDYYGGIRNQLSSIIDVNKFNDEQIEQLYIGQKMGVDITKIFNNKLTAQQIKFLCVLLATGRDITNYVIDPNFDVEEAFALEVQ